MPADEPTIRVGRVGRPHGLNGAFIVEDASEDPRRFEVGAPLIVGGKHTRVEESKRAGGRLVLRLDRAVARGEVLALPREALPAPEEGEYYVFQLVGLEVLEDSGRRLGRVRDVAPGVANDILELDTGLSLPMVDECVLQVDLGRGRILVAQGFADPR